MVEKSPMQILHNAHIYTMDPGQPYATSMVIHAGRIMALGGDELLHDFPGAERRKVSGQFVLPGFTDSHLHLQQWAFQAQRIDCELPDKESILQRVRERVNRTPEGQWVLGHGWNQNTWGGEWPLAADLDAISTHHPIYLTARSLHAGWANTPALSLACISRHTPEPMDGLILRLDDGQPAGIILEKAMEMVDRVIPKPSSEELGSMLKKAIPRLWQCGLTGVHNFDKENSYHALQLLQERGELGLRVVQAVSHEYLDQAIEAGCYTGMGDDMLRIGSVKLFADGALGPHTGAMLDPYENEPENRGILFLTAAMIHEVGVKASAAGLSLAIHAIGDRANRAVLDGYSLLRAHEKEAHLPALRHRIEHVQVIHPEDASRLAELCILASMQPAHVVSDMEMADKCLGERTANAYAWHTQLKHGATLIFGSDAPVEDPNPFLGLHAAVTRFRSDGFPGLEGWHPTQRISRQAALEAYTLHPAWAAGMEDRLGKLVPGFAADLVVVDFDPFHCDPSILPTAQASATMLAGEWVWQS
jgi:predicted amidohydrolase YtcJ